MADTDQVDETTTQTDGASSETEHAADDFDKDRALATIRKLRERERTLAAQAKEAEELKKRLQAIEDKDKSETERQAARAQEAMAKLAAAEQRAADLALQMAVERAARKLSFIDEDDAYRLLDRSAVETDDDGRPTNVEALLKDLAKAKPHLVKAEDDASERVRTHQNGATRAIPPTPRPNGRPATRADVVQQEIEQLRASGRYAV